MKIAADRPTIVVAATLAPLALLVLYWMLHFFLLRQDFVADIDNIQPRTARLLGMVDSLQELEMASSYAGGVLEELAYPAGRDSANTAVAMQKDIRELMTDAGLSVSGSQILKKRKSEEFDRLTLEISAQGNIDALEEALANLETMRPMVFIKSINVKPSRASRSRQRFSAAKTEGAGDPRTLTAQFNLFSLRMRD
ncbi:MAG: general secretion pathway protein M [Halioglobus sp.]